MSVRARFRIREQTFVGEKEYVHGIGMTWDDIDVVVDLEDGEEIVGVEQGSMRGPIGDEAPWIRVWVKTPLEPPPVWTRLLATSS